MNRKRSLVLGRSFRVLAFVACCGLAGAVSADQLQFNLGLSYNDYLDSYSYSSATGPRAYNWEVDDALGATVGHASTDVNVDYGVIKADASALITDQATPASGGALGSGFASYSVDVTPVSSVGALTGTINESINIRGLLSSVLPGGLPGYVNASSYYSVSVNLTPVNFDGTGGSDGVSGGVLNGVQSGVQPTAAGYLWTSQNMAVNYGEQYTLQVGLSWGASANIPGPGYGPFSESADVELGHTVLWAGSQGYDANGNLDSGYQLLDTGGRNWALPAATPEPGTWLAMVCGVGFLGMRRFRRR